MNRKVFVISIVAAIAIFGLGSCLTNRKAADIHNSKDSLDWTGVYKGTIPAASSPGINVSLKLSMDNTYELTYDYIDRSGSPFTNKGSFKWNDTGDIINLGIAETPSYYKVAENKLIQLDMKGKVISGRQADNYVLTKEL